MTSNTSYLLEMDNEQNEVEKAIILMETEKKLFERKLYQKNDDLISKVSNKVEECVRVKLMQEARDHGPSIMKRYYILNYNVSNFVDELVQPEDNVQDNVRPDYA